MKFKKKVLQNGLRMIAVPMADNPTVTVLVLVETGSKYEPKEKNGISHFLEHMCFKGTANRPNTSDLSKELDTLGCEFNAFTGQEFTGYYAKGKVADFPKLIDIISDLYLNPLLKEDEIEKEKGVIVDEINMYDDMPMQKVHEVWTNLLYGDQSAGWPITGLRDVVRGMSRKDFVAYRKAHYVASATTVIVSGNIDTIKAFKEITKRFKGIALSKKGRKKKTRDMQQAPQVAVRHKETDQTHFILGVRSFPIYDKRNSALSVLGGVLGSGMSSRLFRKIRDEMGVGYYVRAGNSASTDSGYFAISAGVSNDRLEEVLRAVMAELENLKNNLVPAEELSKVKEHLVGMMYLGLESSDDLAEYYGVQEILHRENELPQAKEKRIRAVTAADVQKVARTIFIEKNLNLALIGPFEKGEAFLPILALK
ncbi:MAG: Peptidase M16 domain protein [Parcubacteria group bacterium GW2011_GWA1_47_8]|nr:MAG: Peptidase M16 domain protein [Parcubacteria group bacterium GW2011_GWA1_47_8]KKW07980.1 MAG: Peptidase M16 domain protein [Parcubacteria group bacterium GW2011_GWA2_49_16]